MIKMEKCLICGENEISWIRERIFKKWWCKECEEMEEVIERENSEEWKWYGKLGTRGIVKQNKGIKK